MFSVQLAVFIFLPAHGGRRKVARISLSHQSPQVRIPDLRNTRKLPTNVNLLDGKHKNTKINVKGSINLRCQYQDTNKPCVGISMHSKHSSHGFQL